MIFKNHNQNIRNNVVIKLFKLKCSTFLKDLNCEKMNIDFANFVEFTFLGLLLLEYTLIGL